MARGVVPNRYDFSFHYYRRQNEIKETALRPRVSTGLVLFSRERRERRYQLWWRGVSRKYVGETGKKANRAFCRCTVFSDQNEHGLSRTSRTHVGFVTSRTDSGRFDYGGVLRTAVCCIWQHDRRGACSDDGRIPVTCVSARKRISFGTTVSSSKTPRRFVSRKTRRRRSAHGDCSLETTDRKPMKFDRTRTCVMTAGRGLLNKTVARFFPLGNSCAELVQKRILQR